MNRFKTLFEKKQRGLLSVYFCAGHPTADSTLDILTALQEGGADMVEVGIPFSDPLADGPAIQQAATTALRGGMTVKTLMDQLRTMRPAIHIPVVLMGYLNPILHYGFERFCRDCRACGVDGLIIPDLPFDECRSEFAATAHAHGLEFIFLVTPETPEERIRLIDDATDAFIYAVSAPAVTGAKNDFSAASKAYFARLEAMRLKNPLLVGFGISNRTTRAAADAHTSGVIVGSKFVKLLESTASPAEAVSALVEALDRD